MNGFNPEVSIVIPVYNGANYLREAIDSALAQTYSNCEILVINDGSADNGATRDIALSYGNRIRYFEKKNGGVASALNLGIREMRGEYFSWLSHDDVYYPEKVAVQIERLRSLANKPVILYSDYDLIDETSQFIRSVIHDGFKPDLFCVALLKSLPLHGCDALVPKKCFERVGLFNESLRTTNDYDMWFRLAQHYEFVHIPERLIQGRNHAERDSVKKRPIQVKEINDLNIWMLDNIPMQQLVNYSAEPIALFYLNCVFDFVKKEAYRSSMYSLVKSLKQARNIGLANSLKYFARFIKIIYKSIWCMVWYQLVKIKKTYIKSVILSNG